MKIFDVVARGGEYTGQDGQTKTRWINCGAVFKNEQGNVSMKLDSVPVARNENGELWLSFFEPRQQGQSQGNARPAAPAPRPAAPAAPAPQQGFGVPPDDIPF